MQQPVDVGVELLAELLELKPGPDEEQRDQLAAAFASKLLLPNLSSQDDDVLQSTLELLTVLAPTDSSVVVPLVEQLFKGGYLRRRAL